MITLDNDMAYKALDTNGLMKLLQLTEYRFYELRRSGVIPDPDELAARIRKRYSAKAVAEIVEKVGKR